MHYRQRERRSRWLPIIGNNATITVTWAVSALPFRNGQNLTNTPVAGVVLCPDHSSGVSNFPLIRCIFSLCGENERRSRGITHGFSPCDSNNKDLQCKRPSLESWIRKALEEECKPLQDHCLENSRTPAEPCDLIHGITRVGQLRTHTHTI